LVKAGLLPDLALPGMIGRVGLVRRAVMRPSDTGSDPLAALAAAILSPIALPELAGLHYTPERLCTLLTKLPEEACLPIEQGLSEAGKNADLGSVLNKGILSRRERRADQRSVARLFRSVSGYEENIRSILELRLEQFGTVDRELRRAIQQSIGDLPGFPAQAIGNIRNIVERSFVIIWIAEFPDRKIPSHLFDY